MKTELLMNSPRSFSYRRSIIIVVVACCLCAFACRESNTPPQLALVHTLAGLQGLNNERALFGEPFGVAVGEDETIYVSDGARGRIIAIAKDDKPRIIAENLSTPSGLAIDKNGALLIAETGAHIIRRISFKPSEKMNSIVAGTFNQSGFQDGAGEAAMFSAPVGITVDKDNTIFVADSYNDAIRRIDANGNVTTIYGSPIRVAQTSEEENLSSGFNTPCGIAMLPNGNLIIADTGNNRVRVVTQIGEVKTLMQAVLPSASALNNEASSDVNNSNATNANLKSDSSSQVNDNSQASNARETQQVSEAEFAEPVGVAVDAFGKIYVTEAGAARIKIINFAQLKSEANANGNNQIAQNNLPQISTLTGAGERYKFADGDLQNASFARPYGIACTKNNELIVADSDNKLVRFIGVKDKMRGRVLTNDEAKQMRVTVAEFRTQGAARWCYEPTDKAREIAATFGEVRGAVTDEEDGRFHNGIDIPGAYGETVLAMRDEIVLRPIAVEGAGGARERLRLPQLGYIHLRVGRAQDDKSFDESKFQFVRDAKGKVAQVRVRRGAIINAGERIGSLNNQNHTHLIAGSYADDMTGLAALALPGIEDSQAPIFETGAIRLFAPDGTEFTRKGAAKSVAEVRGDVRITARVYDRMNGGQARRKLGVYRLGFQILNDDNVPLANFAEPRWTIVFDCLSVAARADGYGARTVYAKGSQAGYSPETIFDYIVTNTLKDGATTEDFWRTDELPEGIYTARIFAEDYFGNRSVQDAKIRIER